MNSAFVRRNARVLNALVSAALVWIAAALYVIPMAVGVGLDDALLLAGKDHLLLAYLLGSAKAWSVGWWRVFDPRQNVLTVSWLLIGVCAAAPLRRVRRRLRAILKTAPELPCGEECL